MSTKTMTKPGQPKKESPKKAKDAANGAAVATSSQPKGEKKSVAAKPSESVSENMDPEMSVVDPDELEEQEDEASAEASSGGGNAAALAAAASGSTEMSASFKNFRHHPDMENFYRFIYENDLPMKHSQLSTRSLSKSSSAS